MSDEGKKQMEDATRMIEDRVKQLGEEITKLKRVARSVWSIQIDG